MFHIIKVHVKDFHQILVVNQVFNYSIFVLGHVYTNFIKTKVETNTFQNNSFLHLYVLSGRKRWKVIGSGIVHRQCQQKLNQTKGFVLIQNTKHEGLRYLEKGGHKPRNLMNYICD